MIANSPVSVLLDVGVYLSLARGPVRSLRPPVTQCLCRQACCSSSIQLQVWKHTHTHSHVTTSTSCSLETLLSAAHCLYMATDFTACMSWLQDLKGHLYSVCTWHYIQWSVLQFQLLINARQLIITHTKSVQLSQYSNNRTGKSEFDSRQEQETYFYCTRSSQ
jgi:hypothetical protein